jgi:hypothetical protein
VDRNLEQGSGFGLAAAVSLQCLTDEALFETVQILGQVKPFDR